MPERVFGPGSTTLLFRAFEAVEVARLGVLPRSENRRREGEAVQDIGVLLRRGSVERDLTGDERLAAAVGLRLLAMPDVSRRARRFRKASTAHEHALMVAQARISEMIEPVALMHTALVRWVQDDPSVLGRRFTRREGRHVQYDLRSDDYETFVKEGMVGSPADPLNLRASSIVIARKQTPAVARQLADLLPRHPTYKKLCRDDAYLSGMTVLDSALAGITARGHIRREADLG